MVVEEVHRSFEVEVPIEAFGISGLSLTWLSADLADVRWSELRVVQKRVVIKKSMVGIGEARMVIETMT